MPTAEERPPLPPGPPGSGPPVNALREFITRHEGYRQKVYTDSVGVPTIGIGFNMEGPNAKQMIEKCGGNYLNLLNGKDSLTPEQVDWLFEQSVICAIEYVTKVFPELNTFSINRQKALIDMMFNLGPLRFEGFKGMISAINLGNWQTAAIEALDSLWAKQVGERAHENASMLAEG